MADDPLRDLLFGVQRLHRQINDLHGDAKELRCMSAAFGDVFVRVVELLVTVEDLIYLHKHGKWPPCSERRRKTTAESVDGNREEGATHETPF